MSLDGTSNTFIPYTINGINPITGSINTTNFVKYSGNTSNTDLNGFDLTTAGTISAQQFAIPDNNSNNESWITYTISTMGNLSTVGGIITTDLTNGRSMYFTGGVLGAPNFQFATLGNGGKVVATDANGVMSTTIGVGQLNYITALTSQAGGIGQNNTWTGTNDFQTLTSVGALRITSSVVNADYTLSVNSGDQLEITNLSNGSIFKTNGNDLFVSGDITCATLGANDVSASGSFYLAKTSPAEWRTTLGMSDEYEILDNAGVMRLRLSKTTGLTVSTMNITQVPSATPSLALGVNGSGGVVSFAVPAAVNLLPLNNVWTGTNQFNNSVLLNTATAQGSLTVFNSTDSLPGGGSGSALAIFAPTATDSAVIFGCSANTTFAIRSSGSLSNPTLALYSPTVAGMLTFTQNEATMTHGGDSFSLGNTRFLTSTVNSGVSSASVLAVSPTTISSAGGTFTALANSTTIEWRMRIVADWIGGVNYTLTMVNTNWTNVKTPIQITVQSPIGTTRGSTFATLGGTSQVSFTYPQGANGNIYIYIYYSPLGPTPTFTWTTLSVVANVLRSNLYSTKTAMAVNTTVPSFAGLALQSITAPNGAGNETTIENFIVGDVSAGTKYPKGYSVGFNAGNLTANILCQQASSGSGTTFYDIASQASYHSWKSRPNTGVSVDMVLDYNAGNGGLRLNKNGAGRTSTALLDVAGICFLGLTATPVVIGQTAEGTIRWFNPNGSVSHWGYPSGGGSDNYIRGTNTIVDTPLQLNSSPSGGLPRIQSNNGLQSLSYDSGQGVCFIRNDTGVSPLPWNPATWANNGYTVISRGAGVNTPGLGLGCSYNGGNFSRSVVIGLNPGIQWGELILSSGTIYTSCFGTLNNYTNGGGWVFLSDKRIKKDIKDIKTARSLQRIMALKPKTYKKIYPESCETPIPQEVRDADHIGFLAQDVIETNPHCVLEHMDETYVCDGDDGKRLGIAYGDINIHMVGAIQELKKQNDAQQKEIDELRALVQQLLAKK